MNKSYIKDLETRFLRYVQIDTQSDESSKDVPSTAKQYDLLHLLEKELQALGAQDITLTDYACLLATIPATIPADTIPTIALLAHVDTAPAFSGTGVKPIVHRNYNGDAIVLPDAPERVLTKEDFPALGDKIGHDIVTASGTTLLGADDKAGVAILMTLTAHLLANPQIPHGKLRLCFTPDEEVGRGVVNLKLDDLGADVAYTLDGSNPGEITAESFSADKALVKIKGVSTHPGTAKGKMVNALHLAAQLITMLPELSRRPETTEDHEGFIHLYQFNGTTAETELHFILRDFEMEGLKANGDLLQTLCNALQKIEPRAEVTCTITPQYRNMWYKLQNNRLPVDLAMQAVTQASLTPARKSIRGGTDGSGLTARGLPTPDIFTGMQNFHGPLEWVSLQDMEKSTQVCINLVQLWAQQSRSDLNKE